MLDRSHEVLQGLPPGARRVIPAVMFAGVYLPDRQAAGRSPYGDVPAQHLMELQRGLGEGPALDALAGEETYSDDLGTDLRWPRLATVIPASLRAGMALPLRSGGRPIAALVLASDRPAAFDSITHSVSMQSGGQRWVRHSGSQQSAHYFAIHAGLALDRVIVVDSLQRAIHARETIGPAIGILSETYHIDADSAFQALRQASQATNIKVIELAADIVQTRRIPKAVAHTARALQTAGSRENEA